MKKTANELLNKWLSIIAEGKATMKAEPLKNKLGIHGVVSDEGDTNAKFIADLIKETISFIESPQQLSPYNPAHLIYGGNCPGIFNSINDEGIMCCNECGMTINELIENIEHLITKDFNKAVEPAIRYLLKNWHPHTSIYINYDTAELLTGEKCHNLTNEVPD